MKRQLTKIIKMVKKQEMLNYPINDMYNKTMKLLYFTYRIGNLIKFMASSVDKVVGNGNIHTQF